MFRLLEEAGKKDGARLAFQTSHTLTYESNVDQVQTKDGAVATAGGVTCSMSIEALSSNDPLNEMLKDAAINGKELECWIVDLNENTTGNKYKAEYCRGVLENWEVPSEAEGVETFSTSFKISGIPQKGEVELSEDQAAQVSYVFRDT